MPWVIYFNSLRWIYPPLRRFGVVDVVGGCVVGSERMIICSSSETIGLPFADVIECCLN